MQRGLGLDQNLLGIAQQISGNFLNVGRAQEREINGRIPSRSVHLRHAVESKTGGLEAEMTDI